VDVSKFSIPTSEARATFKALASTAELAERHEDMCAFMKQVVQNSKGGEDLSFEERNLLSVAYKNAVGTRRSSWRTLVADEHKNNPWIQQFKKQVEEELEALCLEVLDLLETVLIPNEKAQQYAQVFYKKMAGDYYRYLAELSGSEKGYDVKSSQAYDGAYELAKEIMKPTDVVRLGLALNYSVCLFEIVKDKAKACELAHNAFEEAIQKLDKVNEQEYRDGTLILQLLRDNLTLWTSDPSGDDYGRQDDD